MNNFYYYYRSMIPGIREESQTIYMWRLCFYRSCGRKPTTV